MPVSPKWPLPSCRQASRGGGSSSARANVRRTWAAWLTGSESPTLRAKRVVPRPAQATTTGVLATAGPGANLHRSPSDRPERDDLVEDERVPEPVGQRPDC